MRATSGPEQGSGMGRASTRWAAAAAVLSLGVSTAAGTATAEPGTPTQYMFGRCYDSTQPAAEKPQRVVYGCDSTNVMADMTWSSHAWNPLPADKPGCPENVEFYSDFTVAYPAGVPPWVVPGTAWGSDVEYTYVDGMPAVHFFDQLPYSCTPLN